MAIMQQYRGNEDDWDVTKMKPGQFAVSLDRKYVRMCFAPGVAEKMALYDAFEEDMLQIQQILATCEDIQVAVEAFEVLAEQHANDAAASATASANSAAESSDSATLSESWAVGGKGIRPGEDTNNAKYWAGVAQAVADVQIMTPTQIGIGKPDDITIGVSNGTLSTKFKHYTSLADIGLTAPKTCLEIATAMANNSSITLIESEITSGDYVIPGIVTITRYNNIRAYAYNTSSSTPSRGAVSAPREFIRYIRTIDSLASNWTERLMTNRLTANLLATQTGSALDATMGKTLNDKITTNTTDIATLNSKLNIVGASYIFAPSSAVTLEPAAYKTVISGTLPAGTYLIIGSIGYDITSMARMDLAESTSSEPFCFTMYGATLTRIVTFTQSTNIQLRCLGQGTVSTDNRTNFINAVRLR